MSKFDIDKIKQGILCCMSDGHCDNCPYKIFANDLSKEWCEEALKKDIEEIFLRFKLASNNLD